jgi:unconventional SNARE in the endoplasmic reticulum protein 1
VEPPERKKIERKNKSNKDEKETILKEIKQISDSKYSRDLRKELFDGDDSSGLRRRGGGESVENMEKYYENIQEKLSEEMISLTRNLKEQTLTASKIILKDTDVLTKSARTAHTNMGSLEKEAKKLDQHNQRACKCWLWIMIGLVIAIFIAMVLFMKIVKKSKY